MSTRIQDIPVPPRRAPAHRISLRDIGAALPDFGMAGASLLIWCWPTLFGERALAWLLMVAIFEFIVLHSTVVLGTVALGPDPRPRKVGWVLALSAFYSLFAGGFSMAFNTWWPLWSFWGLTLNRLLGVILPRGESEDEKQLLTITWLAATVLYVLAALGTAILPLPRLGISDAVIAAQDLPGRGLWIEAPQRAVALCFVYFTSIGLFELFGVHRRIQLSNSRSRASTASST